MTLGENILERGKRRDDGLEERQVVATRIGDSHPAEAGETALK